MDADSWIKILHELGITIAAVAAAIAAGSSLKNGRTLNGKKTELKLRQKKTRNGESKDWYKKPDV